MKRSRPEETTLPTDIAQQLHENLVPYGVLDLHTLRDWHACCRAYRRQWLDATYLVTLLECARSRADWLYITAPNVALNMLRLVTLDTALLAVRIGEALAPFCTPVHAHVLSLTTVHFTRYTELGTVLQVLRRVADDARVAGECKTPTTQELPVRLSRAFRRGALYVRRRYGWVLQLEREVTRGAGVGRKTEKQDVRLDDWATQAPRLLFTDQLSCEVAPDLCVTCVD